VRPLALWALAAILVVAAAGLGATQGRQWWEARQRAAAGAAALAAGRQLAVNFVTVDYRRVNEDTARVKEGATGAFLESYSTSLEQLSAVIVENKTISTAERTEAALVSGDRDSARVLVGVVAPTRNTAVPDGEKKTYRMRLDLRRAGDVWKVANLEFVG
jgi:Mce-associated membrane protein